MPIEKNGALATLLSFTRPYKCDDENKIRDKKADLIRYFLDENKEDYCFDVWIDSEIINISDNKDRTILQNAFETAVKHGNSRAVKALLRLPEIAEIIAKNIDGKFFRIICQESNEVLEILLKSKPLIEKIDVKDLLVYSRSFTPQIIDWLINNDSLKIRIDSYLKSVNNIDAIKEICKKSHSSFMENFSAQFKNLLDKFIPQETIANIIKQSNPAYVKLTLEDSKVREKFDGLLKDSTESQENLVTQFLPYIQAINPEAASYLLDRNNQDSKKLRESIFQYVSSLQNIKTLRAFFLDTQNSVLKIMYTYDSNNILTQKFNLVSANINKEADAYSLIRYITEKSSPALLNLALKNKNLFDLFKNHATKILQIIVTNNDRTDTDKVEFLKIVLNNYQDTFSELSGDSLTVIRTNIHDAIRLALGQKSTACLDILVAYSPEEVLNSLGEIKEKHLCRYLERDNEGNYKLPEIANKFVGFQAVLSMDACKPQEFGDCINMQIQETGDGGKAQSPSPTPPIIHRECKSIPNPNYDYGIITMATGAAIGFGAFLLWPSAVIESVKINSVATALGGRSSRSHGPATPIKDINLKAINAMKAEANGAAHDAVAQTQAQHLKWAISIGIPLLTALAQSSVNKLISLFTGEKEFILVCNDLSTASSTESKPIGQTDNDYNEVPVI